jgi:hypothetical protein
LVHADRFPKRLGKLIEVLTGGNAAGKLDDLSPEVVLKQSYGGGKIATWEF